MKNLSERRNRGVFLSASGVQRLNRAIHAIEVAENEGKRLTIEDLSSRTGISASTLSRLWTSKSGVDRRTLHLLFSAFKLELQESDIQKTPTIEAARTPSPDALSPSPPPLSIKYPSGPVPLASHCYIQRPGIDDCALQEIIQPGCVIRIKAPSGFGKTSLVIRLMHYAEQLGYAIAHIDLQQAETKILAHPSTFLQWFCTILSRKLGLEPRQTDYWDEVAGCKLSTTIYMQDYILTQVQRPLAIAINELNCLFEYPNTAQNVLPLLRSWQEEAQHDELWQQLRLVVAYSTESYLPLDINQSPFNVGLPLSLPEFTSEQVQILAEAYNKVGEGGAHPLVALDVQRLLAVTGGNPLLVNIALYHLYNGMTLDDLLQSVSTQASIYRNHLQRLLAEINQNSHRVEALQLLLNTMEDVPLKPALAYQLEGLGVIQSGVNGWHLSSELYRVYFQTYLAA